MLPFHDPINDWIQNLTVQSGWPIDALLRLVLAMIAGGLVGLEREMRGRQAGFRTNLLVCVGSALAMLVSVSFASRRWNHDPNINVNVDPARIAYSILTGIGFIGAGTIIKHEASVRGLTTAAAMWCIAAIGMAAGFGLYTIAVIATVIVLGALWFLDYLEDGIPKVHYRVVVVRCPWKPGVVQETVDRLKRNKLRVSDADFERSGEGLGSVDISLSVTFKDKRVFAALEREFEQDPNCDLLAVRHG